MATQLLWVGKKSRAGKSCFMRQFSFGNIWLCPITLQIYGDNLLMLMILFQEKPNQWAPDQGSEDTLWRGIWTINTGPCQWICSVERRLNCKRWTKAVKTCYGEKCELYKLDQGNTGAVIIFFHLSTLWLGSNRQRLGFLTLPKQFHAWILNKVDSDKAAEGHQRKPRLPQEKRTDMQQ